MSYTTIRVHCVTPWCQLLELDQGPGNHKVFEEIKFTSSFVCKFIKSENVFAQ
jgi:hypothetical protein